MGAESGAGGGAGTAGTGAGGGAGTTGTGTGGGAGTAGTGTGGTGTGGDATSGDFVSDSPEIGGSNGATTAAPGALYSAGGSSAAGAAGAAADSNGSAEATRTIEEADIVQLDGTRLYAMSRYGGLSVIDVSVPDQLRLLGKYRMQATPFEMYVRDGVVIGLFSGWGQYVEVTDGWQWVQTSRVVALDTSDAANITVLGDFPIPGEISDSRIVGDVLYAVAYEDGYCWDCQQNVPRTRVMSLDVTVPQQMHQVDELSFDDVNDTWGWGKRSITVTTDRMYVAGREYSDTYHGSSIQVVDISDPAGTMVLGAKVEAEGEITSRWQMDEYQGILRVVSQPPTWQSDAPPVMQTFTVVSSADVRPLGRADMVLPQANEQLQSVRFDGARGYAVTFLQTDPLFTLDFSNPAWPRQAGSVSAPGYVYYIEPRGDRAIGLGYDQGNSAGAITVSIFDVSNMDAPAMIDRVNFGGDWGYLPEDQDRIHKAFRVLDDVGLILVPFSGWSNTVDQYGCGSYHSGVQLIDFAGDNLNLRGIAPSYGEARRALLYSNRMLTVSDDRVQTFDITNRDAPLEKSKAALAQQVNRTAADGDTLVRLGQDWWTNSAQLDVTTVASADSLPGPGLLDLSQTIDGASCGYAYPENLFVKNDHAFLLWQSWNYSTQQQEETLTSIDISTPSSPTVVSETPMSVVNGYGYYYGYDLINGGTPTVRAGNAIVRLNIDGQWTYTDSTSTTSEWVENWAGVEVTNISNAVSPTSTAVRLSSGRGLTGLLADGNTVLASHFEPVDGDPNRVRFYVDRVDVTDPSAPIVLPSVNVPGSLLAWDGATERAVTVDYRHVTLENVVYTDCYDQFSYRATFTPYQTDQYGSYDATTLGSCVGLEYSLKLVHIDGDRAMLEGTYDVQRGLAPSRAAVGDGRAFVSLDQNSYGYYYPYGGVAVDCFGACGGYYGGTIDWQAPLLVLSGLGTGTLGVSSVTVNGTGWGGSITQLVASGTRALADTGWQGSLSLVDASNAAAPYIAKNVDIVGWPQDITVAGNRAIVSMGMDGVAAVDMNQ